MPRPPRKEVKRPVWVHARHYSVRPYTAKYEKDLSGQRWFVLRGFMEDGQAHEMSYASHFQAMRNGWGKQK